jgi:hypothetical protein
MKLSTIINEIVSGDEIYHYSYPNSISNILNTNTINLSSNLGGTADKFGDRFFFLSLSRTKSLRQGYRASADREMTRIVFDSKKLNARFKSMAVDYWQLKGTKEGNRNSMSSFEYEDRLVSDKPTIDNISNYILRIEGVVRPDGSNMAKTTKDLINVANSHNIPIQIYANEKDLYLKKNPINDSFVEGFDKDNEYKWGHRNNTSIIMNILAINLYDEAYIRKQGGMDSFCPVMNDYMNKNNLKMDIDCYSVYKKMGDLYFDYKDGFRSFQADLHTLFKSGREDDSRSHIMLLVNEMKKYGVKDLDTYYKLKIHGMKPKDGARYKNKQYSICRLMDGKWVAEDNNKPLEDLRGRFSYLGQEDRYDYYDIKDAPGTIGDWLKHLTKKYTEKKVEQIINSIGYDDYYQEYTMKLCPAP